MIVTDHESLQIRSKAENIVLVEKFIDDICALFKVNEDSYGNILVALTEAVNNAITHGNKLNPDKQVEVSFSRPEGKICFTVKDEGEGFDYEHLPDPTEPENLEKPSGRGVFLMRNLADTVTFENNGSIVTLEFNT